MKFSKKDAIAVIKNMFLVVLGTVVLAFGTAVFILPMNIISGGVSGIAIITKALLPFEFITVDMIVFALTWVMFLVGLFVLGRPFAAKTLISTVIYPAAVSMFLRLCDPTVLGGFFDLTGYGYGDLALILAASVGGVFVGLGCALTFIGGGSTGGVDIMAFAVCRFFPRLKSSAVIFAIDALTIAFGMFVMKDLVISLLGILSAFVAAVMVDKVFIGGRAAFVAYVVTEKYEEINNCVIEKLDRTTTLIDAIGGFSHESKKMLMVSFTMAQYADLLAIVGKYDPRAFVIVHRAHEINGEGWNSLGSK